MPIKAKIDVTKLLKEHFFHGKADATGHKPIYADIVLWETPDDKFNRDFRVVQELNREAREAGERGPILGNGEHFGSSKKAKTEEQPRPRAPLAQRPVKQTPQNDEASEDDIPF